MRRGITALELLIVIGVAILVGAILIGVFRGLRDDADIAAAGEVVMSSIRQARSQTLASINDVQYGVFFASSSVIVFVGGVYDSSAPTNRVSPLPQGTQISSVSLGGASQVVFTRLTGGSSASGTVIISSLKDVSEFRTVSINFAGLISIQ